MKEQFNNIYTMLINGFSLQSILCHPNNKLELLEFLQRIIKDNQNNPYYSHIFKHLDIDIHVYAKMHVNTLFMVGSKFEYSDDFVHLYNIYPLVYAHMPGTFENKRTRKELKHIYN